VLFPGLYPVPQIKAFSLQGGSLGSCHWCTGCWPQLAKHPFGGEFILEDAEICFLQEKEGLCFAEIRNVCALVVNAVVRVERMNFAFKKAQNQQPPKEPVMMMWFNLAAGN